MTEKFRKWMKEKRYSDNNMIYAKTSEESGDYFIPTNRMLVVYMIEYLIEMEKLEEIEELHFVSSIGEMYDLLKWKVEEI